MTEYAEGEVLGYVIATWAQTGGGRPTLADNMGELYDEQAEAEEQRGAMEAATRSAGRGERHEVCVVISIEEEN